MRKILFTIIGLVVVLCASARNAELDKLQAQCGRTLDKFDYTTLTKQANTFLRKASDDGDRRYVAYAHFYMGAACLFTNRGDDAAMHLGEARRMGTDLGNDSIVALALNSIAIHEATANNNLYLAQWYFTEALKHAKKTHFNRLEGSVYGNLCTITQIQKDTTGIQYARECYEFGLQQKDPHLEFIGALHLSDMMILTEQLDSAHNYISRAIDIAKANDYKDIAIAYVTMANILYGKKRLEEADHYSQLAISSAQEASNKMVLANAYDQKAHICHERGEYDESNQWLQRELACGESLELVKSQIYELMARNYEAMGNKDEALRCMTRAKELADSTNASDREHMKRERDMSFSIIEQERQLDFNRQQLRNRSIIIGGLVVLILLLIFILWLSYRNLRRRNELYKNIVRQHLEAIEREKMLTARIEEFVSNAEKKKEPSSSQDDVASNEPATDSETAVTKDADNRSRQLYVEACRLMEEERLYADAGFTREELIERLHTNHTYLANAISENGGGNYAQWVNSYRINEAIHILSDRNKIDYPLKDIAADLGFSSQSTFSKLFQAATGMSPSSYRKSLRDL